jgi:hypothetical protein
MKKKRIITMKNKTSKIPTRTKPQFRSDLTVRLFNDAKI